MHELILVADDHPATRALIKASLEREGYLVTLADDGAQAVLKIQEIKPALVILDIQMPGAYGPSLYEGLQKDPATAHIPVLFVSGHAAGAEMARQRVAAGTRMKFLLK